jgi:hypothetical protein
VGPSARSGIDTLRSEFDESMSDARASMPDAARPPAPPRTGRARLVRSGTFDLARLSAGPVQLIGDAGL